MESNHYGNHSGIIANSQVDAIEPAWWDDAPPPALNEPCDDEPEVRPAQVHPGLAYYAPMLAMVEAAGGGFVRVSKGTRPATDTFKTPGKSPIDKKWTVTPLSLPAIRSHIAEGNNAGVFGGHGGIVLLDADAQAPKGSAAAVVAALPRLASTLRIFRDTAPERAKFVVKMAPGEPLPMSQKNHAVGLEILSTGYQGVIAGVHAGTWKKDEESGRWHRRGIMAPILWSGCEVVTVTYAELDALWYAQTGGHLEKTKKTPTHAGATAAAPHEVAATENTVRRVMARLGQTLGPGEQWDYAGGQGKKWIVECPFNPADDPHPADTAAMVGIRADGVIVATCHHARCQERIRTEAPTDDAGNRSGWRFLRKLAGEEPQTVDGIQQRADERAAARLQLDALRYWHRNTDLAEYVPMALQSEKGYQTGPTDRVMLEAILNEAHKQGRTSGFTLSYRKIYLSTGIALGSIRQVMARLSMLIVDDKKGYSIHPAILGAVGDLLDEMANVSKLNTFSNTLDGTEVFSFETLGRAPLATQAGRAAFVQRLTKLTQAQVEAAKAASDKWMVDNATTAPGWLDAHLATPAVKRALAGGFTDIQSEIAVATRNNPETLAARLVAHQQAANTLHAARQALKAAQDAGAPLEEQATHRIKIKDALAEEKRLRPVRPMALNPKLERRLAAHLGSLGRRALCVVDALVVWGNESELEKSKLLEKIGGSRVSLWRTVKELEDCGLVECPDRNSVRLLPDWLNTLDKIEPLMPTAGEPERRRVADTKERVQGIAKRVEMPKEHPAHLEPEQAEQRRSYWLSQQEIAERKLATVEALIPATITQARAAARLQLDAMYTHLDAGLRDGQVSGIPEDTAAQLEAAQDELKEATEAVEWLKANTWKRPAERPVRKPTSTLPWIQLQAAKGQAAAAALLEAAALTDWALDGKRLLVEVGGRWESRPAHGPLFKALTAAEMPANGF